MKKKLVVLTGAGVSAESGITTFRDSNGLWENFKVEDVATIEGWQKDPQLVLDFYNARRAQLADVRPNAAHMAIAALEEEYDVTVITQNVDNLHERAGSTRIIHLHGELTKVRPENNIMKLMDFQRHLYSISELIPSIWVTWLRTVHSSVHILSGSARLFQRSTRLWTMWKRQI